ncbi:MAG: hypothetical protein ACRCSQ_03040, partial [Bacteroidales bacterium]
MNQPDKRADKRVLIRNIGQLVGITDALRLHGDRMKEIQKIEQAALVIRNGLIEQFGEESRVMSSFYESPMQS